MFVVFQGFFARISLLIFFGALACFNAKYKQATFKFGPVESFVQEKTLFLRINFFLCYSFQRQNAHFARFSFPILRASLPNLWNYENRAVSYLPFHHSQPSHPCSPAFCLCYRPHLCFSLLFLHELQLKAFTYSKAVSSTTKVEQIFNKLLSIQNQLFTENHCKLAKANIVRVSIFARKRYAFVETLHKAKSFLQNFPDLCRYKY